MKVRVKKAEFGKGWYIIPQLTMVNPNDYMTDDWAIAQAKRLCPDITQVQITREYLLAFYVPKPKE